MISLFKGKSEENFNEEIDLNNIPQHVAIIMDGNGRWAKERNLPRNMGHKAGVETLIKIVRESDRIGIKYLTLYAFSTENWKRPKDEVNGIMKLLVYYLRTQLAELHRNNVVIRILGDITALAKEVEDEINDAIELTKNNTGLVLNMAFNYGGRDEIIRAVKQIACECKEGKIDIDSINTDMFDNYLYTKDSPDPDLIIRPSGEQRLSNFLLWQCAYSEFWYSNVNWPDFNEEYLKKAIYDYQNRNRRFGGV